MRTAIATDNSPMKICTKKDFTIQTFRSGGKGGQHQNKTDTGVRLIHKPSGISAECRETRSQPENKMRAFRKIAPQVIAWWNRENLDEFEQVKSSEEVRVYHEPDNRVKDHASGERSSYKETVIKGDLSKLISARWKAKKKSFRSARR